MASITIVSDLVGLFTELNVEVRKVATQSELIIARLDSWGNSAAGEALSARACMLCRSPEAVDALA